MKRNVTQLTANQYDLLVIGGGIYGACVAWDAALRGLSVALVEKGDFGGAASANSLKIIHGGLRYLQDGNLRLVRQMSRERQIWMLIAPHLVQPLPCLMPTTHKLTRSRLALKAALTVNDLLSFDRNREANGRSPIPNGRLLTASQTKTILPDLTQTITGAAIWHDAQMLNSERLLISIVQAAVVAGAHVANYVEATDFLREGAHIRGIQATDKFSGTSLTIQAKLVINCAGAWVDKLLAGINGRSPTLHFPLSTATNIITRQLFADYAVALPGLSGEMRFVVPWQGYSIIGTLHQPHRPSIPASEVKETAVQALLDDINAAYPVAALTRHDVCHIHHGYLPTTETNQAQVKLLRQSRIHDHKIDGVSGLLTVVGAKYTTARRTAEQTVNLALHNLGQSPMKSRTRETAVYGGNFKDFEAVVAQAYRQKPVWLSNESLHHLIQSYGTNYQTILEYCAENHLWAKSISPTTPVLQAEIIHAIRNEMAYTLADVVLRRTPLGAAGLPDMATIQSCADLMTAALNWTPQRRFQEIEAVYGIYRQQPPKQMEKDIYWHRNGRQPQQPSVLATAYSQ